MYDIVLFFFLAMRRKKNEVLSVCLMKMFAKEFVFSLVQIADELVCFAYSRNNIVDRQTLTDIKCLKNA